MANVSDTSFHRQEALGDLCVLEGLIERIRLTPSVRIREIRGLASSCRATAAHVGYHLRGLAGAPLGPALPEFAGGQAGTGDAEPLLNNALHALLDHVHVVRAWISAETERTPSRATSLATFLMQLGGEVLLAGELLFQQKDPVAWAEEQRDLERDVPLRTMKVAASLGLHRCPFCGHELTDQDRTASGAYCDQCRTTIDIE